MPTERARSVSPGTKVDVQDMLLMKVTQPSNDRKRPSVPHLRAVASLEEARNNDTLE